MIPDVVKTNPNKTLIFFSCLILSLTVSLAHASCSGQERGGNHSSGVPASTRAVAAKQPGAEDSLSAKDLAGIYARSIDDYIRLVKKEYGIVFDTLYFGKHTYGQSDDFPDITLPETMGNTRIFLVSTEAGEEIMKARPDSFYVNLVGWVRADEAEFIFVLFTHGFSHQFDGFINYKYNHTHQEFEIRDSHFKNYLYGVK